MDKLLVVAGEKTMSEVLLQSLRSVGWKLTVTSDIVMAKQLLQKSAVNGVIIGLTRQHDPGYLKILRFVHEFCPGTLVVIFHSGQQSSADADGKELVQTLDTIDDGRAAAKADVLRDVCRLTPAQSRIAALVAEAYPNREIARKLNVKEQTIRNELSRIFRKLGVWNRVELALVVRTKDGAVCQTLKQQTSWKVELGPALPVPADQRPISESSR
ncbi:MAG TPA: LuxR C-terminal-related transcriptional regulator [Candidatus Angelobacter sp.]